MSLRYIFRIPLQPEKEIEKRVEERLKEGRKEAREDKTEEKLGDAFELATDGLRLLCEKGMDAQVVST